MALARKRSSFMARQLLSGNSWFLLFWGNDGFLNNYIFSYYFSSVFTDFWKNSIFNPFSQPNHLGLTYPRISLFRGSSDHHTNNRDCAVFFQCIWIKKKRCCQLARIGGDSGTISPRSWLEETCSTRYKKPQRKCPRGGRKGKSLSFETADHVSSTLPRKKRVPPTRPLTEIRGFDFPSPRGCRCLKF